MIRNAFAKFAMNACNLSNDDNVSIFSFAGRYTEMINAGLSHNPGEERFVTTLRRIGILIRYQIASSIKLVPSSDGPKLKV